jgi:FKBP-type peptidyl-prolyl cis-trans isomerase FkpA
MPSGLRIAITQPGNGKRPQAGDSVTVHYLGKLLTGEKFDASYDRNQPFTFVLGRRQVIAGWDQGIAELNVGTKAILLIPSAMAYGERGAGANIAPNSPLAFEVELLKTTPVAIPPAPATPAPAKK